MWYLSHFFSNKHLKRIKKSCLEINCVNLFIFHPVWGLIYQIPINIAQRRRKSALVHTSHLLRTYWTHLLWARDSRRNQWNQCSNIHYNIASKFVWSNSIAWACFIFLLCTLMTSANKSLKKKNFLRDFSLWDSAIKKLVKTSAAIQAKHGKL